MPTYLYKNTDTQEIYEIRQSMRDEPLTRHPETGAPIKRIVARPSIAFKGSGFYANDSRPASSEGQSGGSKSGGESKAPAKSEGKSSESKSKGGE